MSGETKIFNAEEIVKELHGAAVDNWDSSEIMLGLAKMVNPRFNLDELPEDMQVMDADEVLQRGVARLFLLFREMFNRNAIRTADLASQVEELLKREGGAQ